MRRLWVRFSVAISSLIVGVVFLILIVSALFASSSTDVKVGRVAEPNAVDVGTKPVVIGGDNDDNSFISRELLIGIVVIVMLSGAAGIIGGVVVSRSLSAPITQLVTAAQVIGKGDLNYRVEVGGGQEIIELGQAFNQMASDLQRAEGLRRNLVADVSHELRTPLTVLAGHLRAALDHIYVLDEPEIANLYEQTHHLIRLVNDMRELAQAEAHQLPLDKTPADVTLLLQELLQTFEPLADEQQITLKSEIVEPIPPIMMDTRRIRQVLHNLMGNALQYTPPYGMVTICASAKEHELRLAIQDTGIGVEPDHIAHIFDRFYRVDFSRSRDTGGTGLGLAVVKAIIETHGGHIIAYSAGRNKGTAFTIFLPYQV